MWTEAGSRFTLPRGGRTADFGEQAASGEARRLAAWVAASGDNGGVGYAIIDKRHARMHVLDRDSRSLGTSAVLLGGAPGDDAVPGIGARPVELLRPEERVTPAGRFVAERGRNLRGELVVWVSYADGISIHPVLTQHPEERRVERLASPGVEDNRISYGCINVPRDFFDEVVRPQFAAHRAIVYILPERKTPAEAFGIAGI